MQIILNTKMERLISQFISSLILVIIIEQKTFETMKMLLFSALRMVCDRKLNLV